VDSGESRVLRQDAPAYDRMDDAETFASHFVERLSDIAGREIRLRYELGRFLHAIRYREAGAFPSDALDRIARIVGTHPSGLRRCARVTEALDADEFEAIARLRGPRGWRVTWSHFELLAEVRSRPTRWRLAHVIIDQRLSVRALATSIRAQRAD